MESLSATYKAMHNQKDTASEAWSENIVSSRYLDETYEIYQQLRRQ